MIDYKEFWKMNQVCMTLGEDIPRVPVSLYLNGDWICAYMQLDCARYYTEYDYQQQMREKCSKSTEKEFGYKIMPEIDFGVILDASVYGGALRCGRDATPVLEPVIHDPEEIGPFISRMENTDFLSSGLVPRFLEWRERIQRDYGITITYGDSIKGCATMLGQLCGITNFLTWIMTDPDEIRELVEFWKRMSVRYLESMRSATGFKGQNKFSFASDVAGMLPPYLYDEFIREAEGEIYERFAPGSQGRRYYHADYHMLHLLPLLKSIGVNEVNVDPYIEAEEILKVMPDTVIYGQIPPKDILLRGTPESIHQCVKNNIRQAGEGKHIVVSTVGSVNPHTSFDNLRAVCEAVEEFGYIY